MRASRWVLLLVVLLLACLAGVAYGTLRLTPLEVLHGALGTGSTVTVAVVRQLRLPRVLLAALVGAGLGASGASLQGATRNPLAEPYLLGVSGGAAVGAVIAVALHAAAPLVPLAGLAGALAAVALSLLIARASGGQGDARVVLMAGVVVGAFANAAIMVALAGVDANAVRGALWWMMGSAADASWPQVRALAVYVAIGLSALLVLARAIDLLALGEDTAAGMGVDVARVTLAVYVAGALLAAGTVAAAGLVGFVGLLVPHLVRMAGARTHRTIIGAAALGGAALVVAADLIARVAHPPAELPLGAVTAILGVPFFLSRLRKLGMIAFERVAVRYPRRQQAALSDVSLTAPRGALTAVVGPNGSGKSTLVRALVGRVPLEQGSILIDGAPVDAAARRAVARRVAVVTQREEPAFPLRVHEYVALGRYPHLGLWRGPSHQDRSAVGDAIARTATGHLADRAITELSGGEWQRVRLARAVAQGGEAIVLDEPTTFLDVGHEMAVFELMSGLAREGRAVLLVSHQLNLVARFADRMVLLHRGTVAAEGTPADVMQGAVLERVYEWPVVVTRDPAVGAPALVPLRAPSRG